MPNQSGTLTSSQGSAFIGTTPNDTITFTPSAGTYTVEYPLGTVAISASTSTQSLPVSGGQVRVTCAGGSVAWAVSDGNDGTPLSQAELLSVRSLVSGAWNKPVLTAIGDSLLAMTYQLVTVASAARSGGILTLGAPGIGAYAGARVRLDGLDTFDTSMRGTFTVVAAPDANTIMVSNPGPDNASVTLGSTPRIQNLQRLSNGGALNWMLILSSQAFNLAELFATSGRRTAGMLQFVSAAAATGAGYCMVLGGTNDIVLDGASAASVLTNLRAIHAAVLAAGMRPIICTIPAPIGTVWTAARAKTIAQVNAGLRSDCRGNGRAILADLHAAVVDPVNASQGSARTGYIVANDVHWTQRGAYFAGKRAWADIKSAVQYIDNRVCSNADTRGFDAGSTNILDSGPWVNTGGTVSAPITGTMATGLVAERGGTCAGVASVPARADGIGYDATMVATPAAANDLTNIRSAGSTWASNVAAGVPYTTQVPMSVSGISGSTLTYGYSYISGTVDGTSVAYISTGLYPSDSTALTEDWVGIIQHPAFTINGAISAGTLYNTMVFSGAGSAVTQAMGRMSMRAPAP